jgi:phosphatidylinositol alpha-1,6-mannosyltransferase
VGRAAPGVNPSPRRDLVFVSAGLGLDGGGRAAAGRLLAAACAGYADERGMGFEILTLGGGVPAGVPGAAAARPFGASHARLAAATWARQAGSRRAACVFDFLGPARLQALVPAPLRAPYLLLLHGLEIWRPLTWTRARALDRATILVANSAHTLERAGRINPGFPQAEVVPLALEERPPAGEPDADLLARAGCGYLLIVGRLASGERYKGHDELLAAMPRLLASQPGARLVVAGDGDDRPRLETAAAARGLAGRVLFTGFVGEATLAELYRRAVAFVMPSRGEGFGLVYLEAMRAGLPCVAARGGAAAEVVADGETGLLVDPGSPAELAAALARLLVDPTLAARLGTAGERRWREEFKTECFRARLTPLLDRLAGRAAAEDARGRRARPTGPLDRPREAPAGTAARR